MQGQIALLLRTMVMYPLAGLLAGYFGFVAFDPDTGQLVVDLGAASTLLAAAIWALGVGGTFAWSRVVKSKGGAT